MSEKAAYFRIKGRPERYETQALASSAAMALAAKSKTKLEVQGFTQWHRKVALPATFATSYMGIPTKQTGTSP